MNPVRRVSAISVLVAIAYSIIAPFAFAQAESNLPACCRRNGAHRCGMTGSDSGNGPAFQSVAPKCPLFPVSPAVPMGGFVALLRNSGAIFAAFVSHPSIQVQTEARSRVSFNRSRQKRGPPAILS